MRRLVVFSAPLVFALVLVGHVTPAPATNKSDPWPQPSAGPSASGDPELLFTFDDGPHEQYTPKILDLLKQHGIHAVFFWTGWRIGPGRKFSEERRAIATRALAEGHLIGNHTIHHAHLCVVKKAAAAAEIDDDAQRWEEITDYPITWMRAPYGDRCRRLDAMLLERGLRHVYWDFDPMEWKTWSADETRDYLITHIRRLRGRAVILIHDTHPMGLRALPKVLDFIDKENARRRARGERPIRILSFADLAREQLAPGVDELVGAAGNAALDFAPGVVDDLLLPLAPRAAATARR